MKWIYCLLLTLISLSLPQLVKREFKIPPIHAQIPFNPDWESASPSPEVLQILEKPFTYFTHGNQTTVFVSQDGNYVLKLFRYRRSLFPLVQKVKNFFKQKPKMDFQTKMTKTLNAAHLAGTLGRDFTQVVYCHLNLTQNRLPTTLFQADRSYLLPLDAYRFVLQRKVTPFKEALLSAKNNPIEMNQLIDSFLKLLLDRSALHLRNSDPNLGPNFGFLEGKAVELDFGNYHLISTDPEKRNKEIENFLTRLEHWIEDNAPEYLNDLHLKRGIVYDPEK
jgi:hypothetical protein